MDRDHVWAGVKPPVGGAGVEPNPLNSDAAARAPAENHLFRRLGVKILAPAAVLVTIAAVPGMSRGTQLSAESAVQPASAEVDSLDALLAEPPMDSVLAQIGDSLFVPPRGQARIIRDRFGVPHIYGETDVDVAYGFGYAQAEDHLVPMLLNYRAAAGRLAEILGEPYLESDYKALLWRIHHVAGERYGSIPRTTRDLIGAFVDGVNHYIEIHERTLPDWVGPVSGTDVVALSRWINLLSVEQAGRPELEEKGLWPPRPSAGSNQWAVGPSRSATGRPILVMDVHLPWQPPWQWYEAHLVSWQGMNVAGGTFFGLPVIVMGHNDRIAWSMTMNEADVFDLYEEKLEPANPKRYLYEREKQRMKSRRVEIRVRGERGIHKVERELQYTLHGPVYKVVEEWAYAARSSVQDVVNSIDQLYRMNRASNLPEFRTAMAALQLPVFNVLYSDVDGNVFYVFNARCPIRSEKYDWRSAVPGWTEETEWHGHLSFSRLPQITNPPSGFIQNCNVAPHLVTVDSGLDPGAFPSYLGWGGFNDRGRRSLSWLLAHRAITVDQMKALARDEYLIPAEELVGIILRAYNGAADRIYDPDGRLAAAVNVLRDWDRRATVSSRATLLFSVWKERFDPLLIRIPAEERSKLHVQEKLALDALRMGVEHMMGAYGRIDVPWGEVHVIERGGRAFPVGGSPPGSSALHDTWAEPGGDGVLRVVGGSSFTMVVDLSPQVRAWSLLPFGNSENPDSPHYSDQAELQGRTGLKPGWFSEAEIEPNTEHVRTVPLSPGEAERVALRAWRAALKKRRTP